MTNSADNAEHFITGCIVVHNEADLLGAALDSLRPVVDRMIVVDHGSTDDSAAVARAHGAEVIDASGVGYEDARNLYLEHVHHGWVLVIDADERIVDPSAKTRQKLHRWITQEGNTPNGYTVTRYEYLGEGRAAVVDIVRLWKAHPDVRYARSAWHASVVSCLEQRGGKLHPTPFALHHLDVILPGRADWKRARARQRGLRELAKPDASPLLYAYMGLEYAALGAFAEALRHYAESAKREPLCGPTAALFTAQAYLAQREYSQAEHWAKQSLFGERVFHGCYHGLLILAEVALARGQLALAWLYARHARAVRRNNAYAHLNLAALALAGHSTKEDVHAHLARAERLNPWIFSDQTHVSGEPLSIFTHQYSALSTAQHPQQLAQNCGYLWRSQ